MENDSGDHVPGWLGGAPSGEPHDEDLPTGETIQNSFFLSLKSDSGDHSPAWLGGARLGHGEFQTNQKSYAIIRAIVEWHSM